MITKSEIDTLRQAVELRTTADRDLIERLLDSYRSACESIIIERAIAVSAQERADALLAELRLAKADCVAVYDQDPSDGTPDTLLDRLGMYRADLAVGAAGGGGDGGERG